MTKKLFKIFSLLAVVVLISVCVGVNASAANTYVTIDGVEYVCFTSDGVYCAWVNDFDGSTDTVNIESSITILGVDYPVTQIDDRAFYYCKSLVTVNMPDTITVIQDSGFYDCVKLTNITWSNSLTTLGYGAFYNCDCLVDVVLPESLVSIGSSAFSNCGGLESIYIPNSVTEIGASAFNGTGLKSIDIPDSLTVINDSTFASCDFTVVVIPDSVTTIKDEAFKYCSNLTTVIVGESVTTIGSWVFNSCKKLAQVQLPASLESIGGYFNVFCSALTDIYFTGSEAQWNNITISTSGNSQLTAATVHYNSTMPVTPSAVGEITVENGSTWLELSWNPADFATGYQIYMNGSKIATLYDGETTYKVTSLSGATDYKFYIRSFSKASSTVFADNSETYTFTTNPFKASFSSFSATTTAIRVNWNAVSGADGYRIYQYIDGSWVSLETVSSSTLTYRIDGLTSDTIYKFKVKAYTRDVDGVAQFGVASDTYVTNTDYTQVQMTTFSATTTAIRINWDEIESADGYRVYQYIDGNWITLDTVSSSTLTYRIDGLTSDTIYKFKVKAYYVSGSTTKWYDASETFVTNTDYTQVQMTSFSATTTAIRINWDEIESADGYRVYQYINGSWVSLETVSSSTFTYRISGLTAGTTYQFKVKAYYRNSSGTAIWYDASEAFEAYTD